MTKLTRAKGQVQTQVFVYILALLVAVLILFYGYGAIKRLVSEGERVVLVDLEKNLKSSVETMTASYERVDVKTFDIPGKYAKICFIDISKDPLTSAVCKQGPDMNPVVCKSWSAGINDNVFLVDDAGVTSRLGEGDAGPIVLDNPGCFEITNSKIKLKITGVGDNMAKIEVMQG